MRSIEVHHSGGAVDRFEATLVRGIEPEDFSLEGDPAYDGRAEGD
jgi:hypothetical protein